MPKKNIYIFIFLQKFLFFLAESLFTVESKKSETLKKPTALMKRVFDIFRHYWVDHKSKFFRSCLVLGGTAIIFPKIGQNKK